MKKKVLTILCILTVASVAVIMTGCGGSGAHRYDHLVTFNYNIAGLDWGDTPIPTEQHLGTMDGKRIMAPVSEYRSNGSKNDNYDNAKFKEQSTGNYTVMGWYLPQTDENGNVRKDENGSVLLGEQWDFSKDVVTQDCTLYAMLKLQHKLMLEYDGSVKETKYYGEGRSVTRTNFITNKALERKGYTFCDFYYDKEFTHKFTFPYVMESEDRTVYAKYIEGDWKVISTADDVKEALSTGNSELQRKNWYFNAEEIDCSSVTGLGEELKFVIRTFSAELSGNGCVIKNLSCTIKPQYRNDQTGFGFFGRLSASANIHDITFENLRITAKDSENAGFIGGAFAHTIEAGARLTNVTVTGAAQVAPGCVSTIRLFAFDNGVILNNCTFTIDGIAN